MRIYLSVDMEGITGVAVGKHVRPGEKDYDRFRRLMTQEANAAINGALEAGAAEVVVSEVDFKRTACAHMATLFPGLERRGPRTIAVTDPDYVRAFKQFWGSLIIGMAVEEGLL